MPVCSPSGDRAEGLLPFSVLGWSHVWGTKGLPFDRASPGANRDSSCISFKLLCRPTHWACSRFLKEEIGG